MDKPPYITDLRCDFLHLNYTFFLYSQVVFAEAIEWMNFIAQDLLYCATSKVLQVFSINHVTNFWTTVRCPLRSMSLTTGSHGKRQKVLAIAEDYRLDLGLQR